MANNKKGVVSMDSIENAQTFIDAQIEITGTVKSTGNIHIEGKLEGDLHCSGDVTLGKNANIKGNLSVNSITVAGTVVGNTVAKDRIILAATARVTGDVKGKHLAMEDGATFVGKAEVNPSGVVNATADEKTNTAKDNISIINGPSVSSTTVGASNREQYRNEEYRERPVGVHSRR